MNPGTAVVCRLGMGAIGCGAAGGGGGTDPGRGTEETIDLATVGAGGAGGGTEPRRGMFRSAFAVFVCVGAGGGIEPRRGNEGDSDAFSTASIRSVIDGKGLRAAAALDRSICLAIVFPEISRRSSKSSMASSDTSTVGSSRMNSPRGTSSVGAMRLPCTAAATASLLKIVVTASKG